MKQVMLVTGSNQGIGYQTVIQLARTHPQATILLGSRSLDNGQKAVAAIKPPLPNVKPLQIDVSSEGSVAKAVEEVKSTYGVLHTLINNAGVGFGGKKDYEAAQQTLDVNYYGVQRATRGFLPLIPTDGTGHIAVVSSQVGSWALAAAPEPTKSQLLKLNDVTQSDVDILAKEYLDTQKSSSSPHASKFPSSSDTYGAYGVSKMLVTAWTRLFAEEVKSKNIPVAVVCPGYCSTNMTSYAAPRTADQGASSVIHAANIDISETGGMFQDGKKHPFAGRP